MADIYTIEVIDRATTPAKRVEAALRNVARAAIVGDKALRSGDAAQIKAARGAERLASSALRAARAQHALAGGARKASSQLGIMGVTLGNLAARGIEMGIRGMIGLGQSVFTTADHVGRMKMAFKGMLGSAELADAEIKTGTKFAKDYGLSIATTLDQLRQFAAFDFSAGQRVALLKMMGDMRAIGMSAEQVERSMLQIGQIQTKGKLQGEELIVLAENGINIAKVYDNLGRRLGKTREQIIKMQKAGQLKSGDALNAVAESILMTAGSSKLGEAGEKAAASTAGGVAGKIGATLEEAFRTSVERAEPDLVRGLNAILKGVGGAQATTLTDALTNAIKSVGSMLEQIGPKLPGFIDSINKIATVLGAVADKFNLLSGLFKLVTGDAAGGAADIMSTTSKSTRDSAMSITGDTRGLVQLGGIIWDNLFSSGEEQGSQFAAGLANGIANAANGPAAAAAAMAAGTVDASAAAAGIRSPSTLMHEQGQMLDAGVARGIEADQQLAFSAATELADGSVMAAEKALVPPPTASLARAGELAGAASAAASSGGRATIGDISVVIQLQGGGEQAVPAIRSYFETDFVALLERHLEGVGA